MEILTRTVLTLLLGHLLTDFVFQTAALVQQKKSGRAIGYAKHGAVYLVSAVALTGFFVPGVVFSWRFLAVVLGLTVAHLAIDGMKIRLGRRTPVGEGAAAFVADQGLHFLTIVVAACWIARVEPAGVLDRKSVV